MIRNVYLHQIDGLLVYLTIIREIETGLCVVYVAVQLVLRSHIQKGVENTQDGRKNNASDDTVIIADRTTTVHRPIEQHHHGI